MLKNWILEYKFFILGFVLSFFLLWPLFFAPYFLHQDDVQTIRLYEINQCFKDGQIPCRWVPDLGGLYGYPLFNYYGPLPYYFGEIFYFLTGSLLISAKIMFGAAFLGAYTFMFLLGRKLWGNLGGLVSGVFYSFAPYHALDFYVRGAMGELWAMMAFPMIIWALLRLHEQPSLKRATVFGISIASLVLSHNLSAMVFAPIIALIFIIFVFFDKGIKSFWKNRFIRLFIFGGLLGLLLSAFYFLPALGEKSLVHLETTTEGYFHYTEHFKGLQKLFVDSQWGYGASEREYPGSQKDGMSYQIGYVHTIAWVLSFVALIYFWKRNRKLSLIMISLNLMALFSIFMIHPRSEFVWKLIPPLVYLQFPWRFLEIIIFCVSLLAGSFIHFLQEYTPKISKSLFLTFWIILISGVVVGNFIFFKPLKFIYINEQQLISGPIWVTNIKRSIFDYLPIYAKAPPAELATVRYKILSGDSNISNFNQGSDWIYFKTRTNDLTFIRLSQYYFPNWQIKVDGKQIPINYQNNLGLITFAIDPGNHVVQAKLYDTKIRSIANVLTLFGFSISLVVLLLQTKPTRRWLIYMAQEWYK